MITFSGQQLDFQTAVTRIKTIQDSEGPDLHPLGRTRLFARKENSNRDFVVSRIFRHPAAVHPAGAKMLRPWHECLYPPRAAPWDK